jgi:hypothetical protein
VAHWPRSLPSTRRVDPHDQADDLDFEAVFWLVVSHPPNFLSTPKISRPLIAAIMLSPVSLSACVSLSHFFEAPGDELIDAFSRLRGLFGNAAMKLRSDAQ